MFFQKRESVWGKSYGDLPIFADYRVHDAAFDMISNRCGSEKSLKVLDIAAGTGAFSQRISDSFPSWDLEINDFEGQASGLNFKKKKIDLNDKFGEQFEEGSFDLVIALEIVEHIENPWNFLREIRRLLRKGGLLVLSTPNIDSKLDRLTYLLYGHSFYFGNRGFTNSGGHITPVPDWLFRKMAKSSGYSHVELNGSLDTSPHMSLGTVLRLLLFMPFSGLYMQNANNRSINVYLCC
jgi:SAM-dependent methyltransferase